MKDKIEELGNRAYIYSIDNLSFAKTLQKKGFDTTVVNHIVQISGKLSTALMNATDSEDEYEKTSLLGKSLTFAKQNLKLLQDVQCKEALLNEKSNLIIETYEIVQELEGLLF